jgi:cysteine desulfuration protein SufE
MTQQQIADELVENFELFDEWEDRYRFLIDMGKKLPPLDESQKIDDNKVHGCQSNVWLVAQPQPDKTIDFVADSDSSIVRGLIAVLHEIYSGQKAQDILSFNADRLFSRLGLDQHLSMGRRNGLYGMVERIKLLAAQNV